MKVPGRSAAVAARRPLGRRGGLPPTRAWYATGIQVATPGFWTLRIIVATATCHRRRPHSPDPRYDSTCRRDRWYRESGRVRAWVPVVAGTGAVHRPTRPPSPLSQPPHHPGGTPVRWYRGRGRGTLGRDPGRSGEAGVPYSPSAHHTGWLYAGTPRGGGPDHKKCTKKRAFDPYFTTGGRPFGGVLARLRLAECILTGE